MPTYEYVCTDCQSEWEEIQKISEDAIQVCPKCGKTTAKRQISGGNFILKGGGWYADLYSSTKKSDSSSDGKSASTASTEKKAESTAPAAKAETSSTASSGSSGASSSGASSSGGSSKT